MNFPDTSFLCSVYRDQSHTNKALDWMEQNTQALPVSSLLILK